MAAPLKLVNTKDLREFDSDNYEYIAYQAALQLAASDSADPGILALQFTDSAGHYKVGGMIDTFYNQSVGTHPGSSLSIGQTTQYLYQKKGTAAETDSDIRSPLKQDVGATNDLREQTSSEVNDLTDVLLNRIMTYEHPGTFRLGSSAPSGDYSVLLSGIFTDTQTDGTTVTYNIYKRTQNSNIYTDYAGSPPTAVLPVGVKRDGGGSGTYEGFIELTQNQTQVSFGQRAKTRIMSSTDYIGAYQL